jgi:hypothetical protein
MCANQPTHQPTNPSPLIKAKPTISSALENDFRRPLNQPYAFSYFGDTIESQEDFLQVRSEYGAILYWGVIAFRRLYFLFEWGMSILQ